MKIKAADIARELGISKATVSLALNNKPGVSEETRQKIKDFIQSVETGEVVHSQLRIIKVIVYGVDEDPRGRMDMFSSSYSELSLEAKKHNLTVTLDWVNFEDLDDIVESCKNDLVAGVILYANEMSKEEFESFKTLNVPVIVYDNDFDDDSYSYVNSNSQRALSKCFDHYLSIGQTNISYLANSQQNFNFNQRREAFHYFSYKHNLETKQYILGSSIDEICERFKELYNKEKIQVVICENYMITIGVVKAIYELGLVFKKDIFLIGIDVVPEYMTYGYKCSFISVSHEQRAMMSFALLNREIWNPGSEKFRVYSNCELILQESA
ncbi:MAG: LacI family DNA-binding transcriptional regulator [Bacillota bacterium]|nr:LacI family DNA-binding transcriptional regulator [Bacillota bacterium]